MILGLALAEAITMLNALAVMPGCHPALRVLAGTYGADGSPRYTVEAEADCIRRVVNFGDGGE